jgi:hypothetical protein
MAKAKTDKAFNVSPGILVLPDGTEISPGGDFAMTEELAKNAGVQSWRADGLISDQVPQASGGGELTVAQAEIERLTIELAAANEQIAKLQAEIEAATTPS